MDETNKQTNQTVRPPVVVVMGHIDHGKSTLLDYIRKTNIVESETGGITQRISAYEVVHKDEKSEDKKITFLDTPGHEAFSKMRERGAKIADIAILVVSATEGVKPQTIEAYKNIAAGNLPYIVAINKIDKHEANIEKTKTELAENEIYLEGYGGKVPFALVSAKEGQGVDELLSLILILAEVEDFKADMSKNASGFVIEAHLDSRRGIQATLIVKDGHLSQGMTVAVEDSVCSTRIMESFLGKQIEIALPSAPVLLTGWSQIPSIGGIFQSFEKKAEAEEYAKVSKNKVLDPVTPSEKSELDKKVIPLVIKADVAGSLEAVEKEIEKIKGPSAEFKIITKGTGPVSESDIKGLREDAIIIAFSVKSDKNSAELARARGMEIHYFDIIYKLTEWLMDEMEKRRPRIESVETTGKAKILKCFTRTKERQIVGGKVIEGSINLGAEIKIMRRDFEIGKGKIVNLEKSKVKASSVEEGSEFGMMIESKIEIAPGDIIECFTTVQK